MHFINHDFTFAEMYWIIKKQFETESDRASYYQDWTSLTLAEVHQEDIKT